MESLYSSQLLNNNNLKSSNDSFENDSFSSKFNTLNGSHSSCAECRDHIKEMIRIHELWQLTKRDLRDVRRNHESIMININAEFDKSKKDHVRITNAFQDEIDSLRNELKIKSDLITNLRKEIEVNSKSTNEVHQQLASIHAKYDEQMGHNTALALRARELESSLNQLKSQKEAVWDSNLSQLKEQLRRRESELSNIRNDLTNRDRDVRNRDDIIENQMEEIKKLKFNERAHLEANANLEQEILRLNLSLKQQTAIFEQQQEERGRLLNTVSSQTTELEILKNENADLRNELKDSTAREEAYESRALGEFRRSRKIVEDRLSKLQNECSSLSQSLVAREKENEILANTVAANARLPSWLPTEIVNLIRDFRVRLNNNDSRGHDHLSSFLVALNEIWRYKMDEKVRVIRQKHTQEIKELKRKFVQQIPYEQVVSKARILRLQKSLDAARQVYLRSRGDNSKNLLDLSLSTVEDFSKQLYEYQKENETLKTQLELQLGTDGGDSLFREGAEYVAEKYSDFLEQIADRIWKSANFYLDKSLKYAKRDDAIAKLSESSQVFLDDLESHINNAKSFLNLAVSDAIQSRR